MLPRGPLPSAMPRVVLTHGEPVPSPDMLLCSRTSRRCGGLVKSLEPGTLPRQYRATARASALAGMRERSQSLRTFGSSLPSTTPEVRPGAHLACLGARIMEATDRLLRRREVEAIVGLSRSTLYLRGSGRRLVSRAGAGHETRCPLAEKCDVLLWIGESRKTYHKKPAMPALEDARKRA